MVVIFLTIIFIHWLADFVCQTDWQAKNKSTSNKALISHTLTYTSMWTSAVILYYLFTGIQLFWFLPITFVAHTIQDYFTSRLNKKLLDKGDTHNFFVSIGFDQVLHYVQLFLTFILLT